MTIAATLLLAFTMFLVAVGDEPPVDPPPPPHVTPYVGVGLADGGPWQLTDAGQYMMQAAAVDAVKVIINDYASIDQHMVNRIDKANPDMFVMARLSGTIDDPAWFVRYRLRAIMFAHDLAGVRTWEVGNEPNAEAEGFGTAHVSAAEYGRLWAEAVKPLRELYPDDTILFPCPSPDASFVGVQAFHPFLRESLQAAIDAGVTPDGLAVHVYWRNPGEQWMAIQAIQDFAAEYNQYDIWVTEFSRPDGYSGWQKGLEYADVYAANYPPNVRGLFAFTLEDSSGRWADETWTPSLAQAIGGR